MKKLRNYSSQKQPRGIALIVCLLLLLMLTVISVSAMQSTVLEEKMAGNTRDYELAFQASETALRSGEGVMQAIALDDGRTLPNPSNNGSTGIWRLKTDSEPDKGLALWYEYDDDWWKEHAKRSAVTFSSIPQNSRYVTAWQQFVKDDGLGVCTYDGCSGRDFHQITSRAEGGTTDTVVFLQSVFAWRYQ